MRLDEEANKIPGSRVSRDYNLILFSPPALVPNWVKDGSKRKVDAKSHPCIREAFLTSHWNSSTDASHLYVQAPYWAPRRAALQTPVCSQAGSE